MYTHLLGGEATLEQFAELLEKDFAAVVKEAGAAVATLTYPAAEWAVPQDQAHRTPFRRPTTPWCSKPREGRRQRPWLAWSAAIGYKGVVRWLWLVRNCWQSR